ncbi:small integral membrane protein 3 isoform X1 [Arvicola amphibius]|uniref:small integral membrane protein 3 isoform X1 n=1 Tax=Arvicola amphibius TaxID=1047088 RepID=UPI0018E3E935|nr:small integral membrane protein 3 isoform X1 [Arvicola amphibius]
MSRDSTRRLSPCVPYVFHVDVDVRANMDAISQSPVDVLLPKHILDIWAIVLIILATVVIMTSLFLCPATAVIIYRMRTHPVLNGAV